MEKGCNNCKFEDVKHCYKICIKCFGSSKWQPNEKENKMGDKISFYEAINPDNPDRMKPNDVFSPDSTDCTEIHHTEDRDFIWTEGAVVSMTAENLKLRGKIIRSKPEVLSVDQIIEFIDKKNDDHPNEWDISFNYEHMRELIDKCHQNGRLERDLELRPSITFLKELSKKMEDMHEIDYWTVMELRDTLNNLKPLNQDD